MESWHEKIQVKKGDFAENIINNYLEKEGYIVYNPITNGPHSFDKLLIKDKKEVCIAEIKAKARMNNYEMTGINYKHYLDYKNISEKHNIKVFIFFVDEMLKEVYGNFLNILEKNHKISWWDNGKTMLFDLKNMIRGIYFLSEEETKYLKSMSTRNYYYLENIT